MPNTDGLHPTTNHPKSSNKSLDETTSTRPKATLTDSSEASSATSAVSTPTSNMTQSAPRSVRPDAPHQEHRSDLQQEVKAVTQKLASGNISQAAQGIVVSAKDALEDVKSDGSQLLHDAKEKAVEAMDYVEERGQALGRRAQDALQVSQNYLRRASRSSVKYVGANALPLALIATGLGWLLLNGRSQRRVMTSERVPVQRTPAYTRTPRPSDAEDREWLERATANARGYSHSNI